jgi:hypothetical protein
VKTTAGMGARPSAARLRDFVARTSSICFCTGSRLPLGRRPTTHTEPFTEGPSGRDYADKVMLAYC